MNKSLAASKVAGQGLQKVSLYFIHFIQRETPKLIKKKKNMSADTGCVIEVYGFTLGTLLSKPLRPPFLLVYTCLSHIRFVLISGDSCFLFFF